MDSNLGRVFEIARRVGFFLLLAAAAMLVMWFDSSPLIRVQPCEKALSQSGYHGNPKARHLLPGVCWAQEGSGKPLSPKNVNEDLLPDAVKPDLDSPLLDTPIYPEQGLEVITVQGKEWEDFFQKCNASFEADKPVPGWEHRADDWYREGWSLMSLWFKPGEPPLNDIMSRLKLDTSYIVQASGTPTCLELRYTSIEPPDLGSGTYGYPKAFIYPYRKISGPLALAALSWYIFLPWPRKKANMIRIKRWTLVMSDLAATIMFGVFFSLPLFIVGSTQGAFGEWIFFSAFFWFLAALGLLMAYWSTWYACYQVEIDGDNLIVQTMRGIQRWRIPDIAEYRPARLRPPRWLIRLLWLGALLGPRTGTAGRALILESSAQDGILLCHRNGEKTYIWTTTSMGQEAIENGEQLRQVLEKYQVPYQEEPLEIRAFFPPTS